MSEKKFKRTLITTALPYANGPVHIGHLAGVYIPADIYARYLRLQGRDVLLVGGSDEHGVPITIKARKEGVTPQDIVDRYHAIIRDSFAELGISFDVYGRTTSDTHRRVASDFFRRLYDKGEFIEKTTEQLYDPEAQQFLADRYVVGTCPHCGSDHAYGDQCEACGTSLNATDLINPRSALSGAKPELRKTSHWYLPLDKWEPRLRQWILEEHKEWKTNVYGQCKSWLDMGLQPRAVSRDLNWGIPVPVEGAEGKVLYVWFDAPIGYISNTIDIRPDDWETWWKSPDTRMLHFIGKDNIVFHCLIFPAMLMADGTYNLPDNVPANEFLNLENDKISTSRNWAVWLHEYLRDFPGKQDTLRYVLTANAPETKDNNFTWHDFQERNNSELVAILGNFVNRVLVLMQKYYNGEVPAPEEYTDADREAIAQMRREAVELTDCMEQFKFRDALRHAMNMARVGNKYLADAEPWKVVKADPERVRTIMYVAVQICANLQIAFAPFLPFMAEKLGRMLKFDHYTWDMLGSDKLIAIGALLPKPEILFEKIEDAAVDAQLKKLADTKKANELAAWHPSAQKPDVDFPTFEKLDIRVGKVLECRKVPKADKLLEFRIDDGMGGRTIVSGIAKYYKPEDLVGHSVCFIANFEPRKLRGIVSEGMILSAERPDGSLTLVEPPAGIEPGCSIG